MLDESRRGSYCLNLLYDAHRFAAAILAGGYIVLAASQIAAEPFRPSDDAEIVERLPGSAGASLEIRRKKAALAEHPDDLDKVLQLVRLYIAEARAEADPRFYGNAAALLEPWLDGPEPPTEVLVLDAVLKQAGHDFEAALARLERVLERAPRQAQARLVKALIERAQGRYAAAAESCRLLDRRVSVLIRTTCDAAVKSLAGGASESHAALAAAYDAAHSDDAGVRLWALTVLGETAALAGDATAAEAHFRAGLALGRRDAYLLAALADLLLEQERFSEVIELLAEETQSDPLLLRLAIASAESGDDAAEDYRRDLAARFDAARRRDDPRHLREESRFALRLQNDPGMALKLALANWRLQREPWDLRLVLEAAAAAGEPSAAAPALGWIEQSGFKAAWLSSLRDRLEERGS